MIKVKAKRLEKGDTIGVISPASRLYNKSDLVRGIKTLEEYGYNVIVGDNANNKHAYLAGTDKERANDFNEMFANKDVDAIFVTQGGYGCGRILKYIDFNIVRENPKILIGFSDITILHLAILKETGLVTFHGPGVGGLNPEELTEYRKEYLEKALTSTKPIGEIKPSHPDKWINVINGGQARGDIVGGNLTLICSSLGTPYEIDTAGKILFFEEVETEPWVIDHMMSHLYNAGKFDKVAGIIVGECKGCEPFKHNPGFPSTFSLEDILEEYITPLKVPAIYGLPLGHTKDLATIPIGVQAYLDASNGKLFIEERGTY